MKTRNADHGSTLAIVKSWLPILAGIFVLITITCLAKANADAPPDVFAPALRNEAGFYSLLPDEDIECFAELGDVLYAGGKNGLFVLNRDTFAPMSHIDSSGKLSFVRSIQADQDGTLWIGSIHGVLQYNPASGSETWWSTRNGLPDNRVNVLYTDNSGRLWVGTWGGAAWYDAAGWHVWRKADGLASDMVNVICEDGLGGMWFGAYNVPDGVLSILSDFNRFTGEKASGGILPEKHKKRAAATDSYLSPASAKSLQWTYLSVEDGIPHSSVTSLIQESPGIMWVGAGFLESGGACQVDFFKDDWRVIGVYHKGTGEEQTSRKQAATRMDGFTTPVYEGLVGEKVRSLFLDSHHRLWLGSEYDGCSILYPAEEPGAPFPNDTPLKWLTTDNGLCDAEIKRVHEDRNGTFWLATRSGITVIPGDGIVP